ncbi:hypothetical protein J4772_34320 [Cohnella sp. LGH]|uniref:hypothetical protein n=1 Tax=Cohnella sp. LGH TaxID=1619153 RepID=UPI001ADB4278|nr:hypothetical protein [Cohnella sp. LGH]QTH42481.1 hypothetical protein J4772_34320 [Cohnella sp. LGH]
MGDFDFQFWQEHMGGHGKVIEQFEKIAERSYDVEQSSSDDDVGKITIAIEAGIVRAGYQVLALKAMQRLIAEDAFAALNKDG